MTQRTIERSDHVDGIADLLPQLLEEVVLQTGRDTHLAVAGRVFALVPGAQAVHAVHDGVTAAVYGLLTSATRRTRRAAVRLARAGARVRHPRSLDRWAGWRTTVGILNGVLGDQLEVQGNPLAIRMAVRVDAHDVPAEPAALRNAFPQATGRVAVFLHGLVETEESWAFRMQERGTTYPDAMAVHGVTPVLVRYNTGRHIHQNAVDLSDLLDALLQAWPVPVTEVVLVGHSMGGLVIRGAGAHATATGATWPDLTEHVVSLGTPHLGAPLEKVANAGAWLLCAIPESRAFGTILRRRSVGIKDLRHGYLSATDWEDQDVDGWRSRPAATIGALGAAVHHSVGATLGVTDRHLLSRALGDLLVLWGSACADGHEWAEEARITHVGGANHFNLLNHPVVEELLVQIADVSIPVDPSDLHGDVQVERVTDAG